MSYKWKVIFGLMCISSVVGCVKVENGLTYEYILRYDNGKISRSISEFCTEGISRGGGVSSCNKKEPRPDVGDYICGIDGNLYLHPKGEGTNKRVGHPIKQEGFTCTTDISIKTN